MDPSPDALLLELGEQIRANGPITFAEYMQIALYHADHGYYTGRVPGDGAHYATSPSLTPWFGRLVANELRRMWETLGCPSPFTVTEVGAGQAGLAAAAMDAAGPMIDALRWRFVERFDSIVQVQRRRLGASVHKAEWAWPLGELAPLTGCLIAHEVLDNFPVHLLELSAGGQMQEVHLDFAEGALVECLRPLSDSALAAPGALAAEHMNAGDRCAVCLQMETWCREAAQALDRGYLLVVDYGDVEPDIWEYNPTGTIATFGPAGSGMDPLELPGHVDITADVNFSALSRALERSGFCPVPVVNQGPWLLSLGLAGVLKYLSHAAGQANEEGRHEQSISLMAERSRVIKLAAEGALGEAFVLIAGKDAPVSWIEVAEDPS